MIRYFRFTCIVLLLLTFSCHRYPRDLRNTLDKVQNNKLVVGVTEHPPYVELKNGEITGTEIELIKGFSKQLNAEIEWITAPAEIIFLLLESGEIDIAAGGFNKDIVWKKHVHFVHPHDTIVYSIGVPPGKSFPENFKDREVTVKKNSVAGVYAKKKKGARIAFTDSITGKENLVAASKEELTALGYQIAEKPLKKEYISLAIQNGENAFLKKLEVFIHSYEMNRQSKSR